MSFFTRSHIWAHPRWKLKRTVLIWCFLFLLLLSSFSWLLKFFHIFISFARITGQIATKLDRNIFGWNLIKLKSDHYLCYHKEDLITPHCWSCSCELCTCMNFVFGYCIMIFTNQITCFKWIAVFVYVVKILLKPKGWNFTNSNNWNLILHSNTFCMYLLDAMIIDR